MSNLPRNANSLLTEIKVATSLLKQYHLPGAQVEIVHHSDADGLCGAAILHSVFRASDIPTRTHCLERTYDRCVAKIIAESQGPLFFVDLGSTKEALIDRLARGRACIILDHHKPGKIPRTPSLKVLNPILHDLTDHCASAATLAYLFARELTGEKSQRMAHMAVVGAINDRHHQWTRDESSRCTHRFAPGSLDEQVFLDAQSIGQARLVMPNSETPISPAYFVALNLATEPNPASVWIDASYLADRITVLGAIGYQLYGEQLAPGNSPGVNGSDLAMQILLSGLDRQTHSVIDAVLKRRESAFAQLDKYVMEKGPSCHKNAICVESVVNGKDLFDGLGLKTIGEYCNHLVQIMASKQGTDISNENKYLVGVQPVRPIRLLGRSFAVLGEQDWIKISLRTYGSLRQAIEDGKMPTICHLIETVNPGYCDGCHAERGATTIRACDLNSFLDRINEVIANYIDNTRSGPV